MIEQLKQARFVLNALVGEAKLDDLRKKVIEEAGVKDKKTGKPVKYNDLSATDKQECDEMVEGLQQLSGVCDDIVKAKAKMTMKFFKALKEAGFNEEQALLIVAHQKADASTSG